MLSLEAYLYDGSFCIRSVVNGVFPLFELEDRYDSANGELVDLIEKSELSDKFGGFFEGYDVEADVVCEITDRRKGCNRSSVVCLEKLRANDSEYSCTRMEKDDSSYFNGFVD